MSKSYVVNLTVQTTIVFDGESDALSAMANAYGCGLSELVDSGEYALLGIEVKEID